MFPSQACVTITGRFQQRRQNTKNRVLILEKNLVLFLTSSSRRSTLITADVLQIGKKKKIKFLFISETETTSA